MKTDHYLTCILSKDKKKRAEGLEHLYASCFPKTKAYILANNGTITESKDIFQDAISVVYENLLSGKFRGDSSLTSYVYSVCRNLWLQELRKRKILTTNLENDQLTEIKESEVDNSLIHQVLNYLDKGCKTLLVSFYFYGRTMKEVATEFELSSVQVAKTKKLRCMKKLRDIIEAHNLDQDRFTL